jgi:outer membrane protein OmpA-like peptidoglycan-associated protein
MEGAFSHDLSDVRIYADARAADAASRLGAAAFTVGDAVHFGAGRYQPDSPDGRQLLAHELAHVVQQRQIGPRLQMAPAGPVPASAPACVSLSGDVEGTPFLFVVGTDQFRPGEQASLAAVPTEIPADSGIEIHGFASEEGPAALNEELSCRRAQTTWRVLVGNGLPPSRIEGVFNHGAMPGPRAERRSALIVARGLTLAKPVTPAPRAGRTARPALTGSLPPPASIVIPPDSIKKTTPKPSPEPETGKKEETKVEPTPTPSPAPDRPEPSLGWKKQRQAGLQLSPDFMYLAPGPKPDDIAALFFLQFSAQHRDPENPTLRQRIHLFPFQLPEPQLQIGAGLDMSWDWHLLLQLVFNVIRIHLGDVDLSGQVGGQADFPRLDITKPSATFLYGPSLQYQKEGSPWILQANGQWNYDIRSGGLTFKNFNFSLSLSREF